MKPPVHSIKDWTNSSNEDFFVAGGADIYKDQNQVYQQFKRRRLLDGNLQSQMIAS